MKQIDKALNKVPKSHLKKLLNGYEVNHYFNRYIRSEYLLFISMCINLISIIVYVIFASHSANWPCSKTISGFGSSVPGFTFISSAVIFITT